MQQINRETWREAVRLRKLTVATVAIATGRTDRAVRSYYEGTRQPSDEWVVQVARMVECIDRVKEEAA